MEVNRIWKNCLIFDTNALIYSVEQKIDLFSLGYKILIPSCVVEELKKLEKTKIAARVALKLIERAEIIHTDKKGDEGILEAAKNYGCGLITNDRKLRDLARKENLTVGSVGMGKIFFEFLS